MKKLMVLGFFTFLFIGLFSGTSYAELPLTNLEGVGGVVFNPLAYPANSASKWEKEPAKDETGNEQKKCEGASLWSKISKPQAGAWYVRMPQSHVNWEAVGTAFSLYDRVEFSYGWEGIQIRGNDPIVKNNMGAKILLLKENLGDHKYIPAISLGGILKNTNDVPHKTHHVGFDTYLAATKLIKETPLPLLLSGGLIATNSRATGIFGYDPNYRFTWFGNAAVVVCKYLAVGYEYKQGAKFHGWHDADYQNVHGTVFINDKLTLVGAWVYAGRAKSSRAVGLGNGFAVSLQYAL